MKPTITLCIFMLSFLSLSLFAQNQEGKIVYTETVKFDLSEMEGMDEMPEEMKAMIPTEQSFQSVLFFTDKESLYSNYEEKEKPKALDYKDPERDIEIQIDMQMPEYKQYVNLKTGEQVESKDLFGKMFLISSKKAESPKWKISNEKKEVAGHLCQKATYEGDEEEGTVEAWFTTEIPVSVGPRKFRQLPGAVLEVNFNNRQILATTIDFLTLEEGTITKPSKGKKVSAEEFKKIEAAKQKEMMEMYGGKGNIIIERDER